MIVSRNDDTTVFAPKKKNKLVKVVSRNAGDPVAEQFTQPPQLKVFNISKGIAKPFGLESLTGKTGVPLKFNQEGSHAGSYLFNAPQSLIISPLSTPVYKETNMKQRETEEFNPPPSNYSYLKNLRPSIRPLTLTEVIEPVDPYPTRPSKTLDEQIRGL